MPEPYRCMAKPPELFVPRHQLGELVELLCTAAGHTDRTSGGWWKRLWRRATRRVPSNPPEGAIRVGITTALRGAGGFGKTTLAQALCFDERVRAAFPDGILWVTLGVAPSQDQLFAHVCDLIEWMGRPRPGYTDVSKSAAELRQLLAGLQVLLVIDDVWRSADLAPFEGPGEGAAVLVTTRDRQTLPRGCRTIDVDAMERSESVALLAHNLAVGDEMGTLARLAVRLGHWPLLLDLVNRQLGELMADGATAGEAIAEVTRALDEEGLTAFDVEDDHARRTAVVRTMAASLRGMNAVDQDRYEALAVFPMDADIPVSVLAQYWGLRKPDTHRLCERLYRRSMLQEMTRGERSARKIRLHAVFRRYLIDMKGGEHGEGMRALHRRWLDALRPTCGHWHALPTGEPYAWRWLAYHLHGAGEFETLRSLLSEFAWIDAKLRTTGVAELIADYAYMTGGSAGEAALGDGVSRPFALIRDALRLSSHVLAKDAGQLPSQLVGRLIGVEANVDDGCHTTAASPIGRASPRSEVLTGLFASIRASHGSAWLCPQTPTLTPPGGPLLRTLSGHESTVRAVVVTPDGKRALSASDDHTVRVWDLSSGKELRTLSGHESAVRGVSVTKNARWALSGSDDQTVKVWDLMSGMELRTLWGHTGIVTAVAVTPDGKRALSASDDQTVKVWDLMSGRVLRTLLGHTDRVTAVAVTPDGEFALSASWDRTVRVWQLGSGQELHTLTGHTWYVTGVAATPDGRFAISASNDDTMKLWDLERGQELYTLAGHTSEVTGIAVTPDGKRAISTSHDHTVKIWDLTSGQVVRTLSGHTPTALGGVTGVAVTPDGKRALSASHDQTVKVWDLESSYELRALPGHSSEVTGVAVTPDGKRALSASEDKMVKLWDVESGNELRTLSGHGSRVTGVAVAPDGKRAISASYDDPLKVWDIESGQELNTFSSHAKWVTGVAVTLDGKRAISASEDHKLQVWDFESGHELCSLLGHTSFVTGVAVTANNHAISASYDQTIKVWNVESGVELHTLSAHVRSVTGLAATTDGKRVVSASEDRTVKVWDLISGQELCTLRGHLRCVTGVAITADGKRAISASEDHMVKVWDLESDRELASFTADAPVRAVACTSDGRMFIAGDQRGAVHFLALAEPSDTPLVAGIAYETNARPRAPDSIATTEPSAAADAVSTPASPGPPGHTAAPAEPDREAFERLLLSLFDAGGLRRFVSYGPQGVVIVAEDLPGETAPAAAQAHAAVSAWIRRGLVTAELFARLTATREHRAADIEAIRRQWVPDA